MYNQNFSKSASSKIVISPLTNMIETSGFLLFTHICKGNTWERDKCKYLTLLEIGRFELILKIDEVF
jgi:hypothetical protein